MRGQYKLLSCTGMIQKSGNASALQIPFLSPSDEVYGSATGMELGVINCALTTERNQKL
jgi:hypothetical protein